MTKVLMPKRKKFSEEGPMAQVKSGCFDSSCLGDWDRCAKLYWIQWEKALKPLDPNGDLAFGAIIHAGLAELYLHDWDVEKALKVMQDHPLRENCIKPKKPALLADAIIPEYKLRYEKGDYETARDSEGRLMVEYEFMLPIGDYTYSGRIDRVVVMDGGYYVLDHKTTSGLFWIEKTHRPDRQFTGYGRAVREILGSCAGIIIDAIEIPKSKGFDRDANLHRFPSPRTDWEYDEFEKDFVQDCKLIETCREDGHWPKAHDCFKYMRMCEAIDVCTCDTWSNFEPREEEEAEG